MLVIFPYEIDFQKFYGLSQIEMGEYMKAVKTFENALKFNKDNSELLFGMGEAKFKSGIISHSELFIRKGLLQDKDNFNGNRILGEILINQNNFIEAEYYCKKAYKKNKPELFDVDTFKIIYSENNFPPVLERHQNG